MPKTSDKKRESNRLYWKKHRERLLKRKLELRLMDPEKARKYYRDWHHSHKQSRRKSSIKWRDSHWEEYRIIWNKHVVNLSDSYVRKVNKKYGFPVNDIDGGRIRIRLKRSLRVMRILANGFGIKNQ